RGRAPPPVARRAPRAATPPTSVIIPCRNEAGHVPELVRRLPTLPAGSEFVFVEGDSRDDTWEVVERAVADNPHRPLRLLKQPGKGKGDAVRFEFAQAKGDVVL